MRLSVAVAAVCLSLVGLAVADDVRATIIRKPTNIPAEALGVALQALAKDRNFQVIYVSEEVNSLRTQGAVGEFTPEEALKQLLKGTGLTYRYLDEKTITILPASTTSNGPGGAGEPTPGSRPSGEAQKEGKRDSSGQFLLAQSTPEQAQGNASVEGPSDNSNKEDTSQKGLPEILVKGSRSLDADIQRTSDDMQPYVVIGRTQIEQSGASNVGELLQTHLTMNYVPQTNDQQPVLGGSTTSISLLGLGSDQTLILIDGRRAAPIGLLGGSVQPDLNSIPLNSVERIEVLPTTASGIYGGSATGGVINVVLRRDYSGLEAGVRYEGTYDGGGSTRRFDLLGGTTSVDGKTSLMISGSYSDSDPLTVGDRSFIYGRLASTAAAGCTPVECIDQGGSPPLGYTTNISSVPTFNFSTFTFSAPNLVLKNGTSLNSPITFIPAGYKGTASDGGLALLANAGHFNTDPANTDQINGPGLSTSLLNNPIIKSLSGTLRRTLNDNLDAFLQLTASDNYGRFFNGDLSGIFTIPASSPNNPFQQAIQVTTPMLGADGVLSTRTEVQNALLGLIAELPRDWKAELDWSHTHTISEASGPPIAVTNATSAAVANGTIDVMRDTNLYPADFAGAALAPSSYFPSASSVDDFTLHLAGELGHLPSGTPTLSFVLERLDQRYSASGVTSPIADDQVVTTQYSSSSQTVDSVYAEARIPVLGERISFPGAQLLELQLAGRYDHYDTVGSTIIDPTLGGRSGPSNSLNSVNPTLGLRFQPSSDVTLRGSFGTGFLPPSVAQLQPGIPQVLGNFFGLTDPKRGNQPLGTFTLDSGGNPDLTPEKSRSWSAGFILTPRWVRGLRMSLDFTHLHKSDDITSLAPTQDNIDIGDSIPGLLVRGPKNPGDPYSVGPIIAFDGALRNIAQVTIRSYDFAVDYKHDLDRNGDLRLSARATRMLESSEQITQFTPTLDFAGSYAAPEWAANATLAWELSNLTVGWTTRYLDSYVVNVTQGFLNPLLGGAAVPSAVYHDVFATYRTGHAGAGWTRAFSDLEIQVGAKNVFNREPRFSQVGSYFMDTWVSPLMGTYYVQVRKSL